MVRGGGRGGRANETLAVRDVRAAEAGLLVRGAGSSMQQELQQALCNAFYIKVGADADACWNPRPRPWVRVRVREGTRMVGTA